MSDFLEIKEHDIDICGYSHSKYKTFSMISAAVSVSFILGKVTFFVVFCAYEQLVDLSLFFIEKKEG